MIERFIEHTLLKPEATAADIMKLCREARDSHFLGVCVNPCFVRTAKQQLAGTDVKVVSVVGFPLGCDAPEVKAAAARRAVQDGTDEIDMVINVGALKEHDDEPVMDDIRQVVVAAGTAPVKVIIETCLLNEEEKIRACGLIARAGAAFVKTSTGFNKAGATVEDVTLLSVQAKKLGLRVKAAGGIRDYATAKAMLAAGAVRLGCSAGVKLAEEERLVGGGDVMPGSTATAASAKEAQA